MQSAELLIIPVKIAIVVLSFFIRKIDGCP